MIDKKVIQKVLQKIDLLPNVTTKIDDDCLEITIPHENESFWDIIWVFIDELVTKPIIIHRSFTDDDIDDLLVWVFNDSIDKCDTVNHYEHFNVNDCVTNMKSNIFCWDGRCAHSLLYMKICPFEKHIRAMCRD